jgi:hypothetical protein
MLVNLVHTLFHKDSIKFFFHPHLDLPSDVFLSGFMIKPMYAFLNACVLHDLAVIFSLNVYYIFMRSSAVELLRMAFIGTGKYTSSVHLSPDSCVFQTVGRREEFR